MVPAELLLERSRLVPGRAGWGRGQAGEEAGQRGVPSDSVTPADP